MSGLEDLYREIILDHYRTPRNRGELMSPPATKVDGHNPLCGDEITLYLLVEGEGDDAVVSDVKIGGQGCSISQSSASMMTQAVIGTMRILSASRSRNPMIPDAVSPAANLIIIVVSRRGKHVGACIVAFKIIIVV